MTAAVGLRLATAAVLYKTAFSVDGLSSYNSHLQQWVLSAAAAQQQQAPEVHTCMQAPAAAEVAMRRMQQTSRTAAAARPAG